MPESKLETGVQSQQSEYLGEEPLDTKTHLDFALHGLWVSLREMAITGAPADALEEIIDDMMQLGRWSRQTLSTIDDTLIRKTAMRWLKIHEIDPKRYYCEPRKRRRDRAASR